MLSPFNTLPIRTGSQWELNRVVDDIARAFRPVLTNPELDYHDLTGVALPAGATVVVNHLLDRQPVGWRIIDATGGYPQAYRTAWDAQTITFQSANACTVALRVW